MILYGVSYNGPITNYTESLVTIHKTLEGAKSTIEYCRNNYSDDIEKPTFSIVKIDTDIDSDIIYDDDEFSNVCEYLNF